MNYLNENEFYDMTLEFLTGKGRIDFDRPEKVAQVLQNLQEVAPEHAKIISEYIEKLEFTLGVE